MNFYVAIFTLASAGSIRTGVSMVEADYTYTINGTIDAIYDLGVEPMTCGTPPEDCWSVELPSGGNSENRLGVKALVSRNGESVYDGRDNLLELCQEQEASTWDSAIAALFVQAVFPPYDKTCPIDGKYLYVIYKKMEPLEVTMGKKLDCGEYKIEGEIFDDFENLGFSATGDLDILFTVPDDGNCNSS